MPPDPLFLGERRLRLLAVLACLTAILIGGCAKFPGGGGGAGSKRLIFKMTMDGPINPGFVYIVALNPSTLESPITQGPIPVIAPPWGNGFVAGGVTYFVRWDTAQSPHFLIYQFRDGQLIDYFERGVPVNYLEVGAGDKTIQFEIDLAQIASSTAEADTFQSVQVNFLTMDRVPQGTSGDKFWDALGDGRLPTEINEFVNIPLRTSGTYDNRRFQDLEPRGDAPDPALDIIDWSVEVRLR